jgi:hypothetical protein
MELYDLLTAGENNIRLAYELRYHFTKDEWFDALDRIMKELVDSWEKAYPDKTEKWYVLKDSAIGRYMIDRQYELLSFGVQKHWILSETLNYIRIYKNKKTGYWSVKHRGDKQLKKLFSHIQKVIDVWKQMEDLPF